MIGISTYGGYYEKGKGWWVPSSEMNALFFVGENTSSRYVHSFDSKEERQKEVISKTLLCENKLYFFSRHGYEFWTLEKNTEEFEYRKIRDYKGNIITNVEIVGDSIWMFPDSFDESIVKYNIKEKTYMDIDWNCDVKLGSFSITRTTISGDSIIFTNRLGKDIHLFKLNAFTNRIDNQNLPQVDYINCIAADSDNVWMLYKRNESTYIGNTDPVNKKEFDVSEIVTLKNSPSISYFKMIDAGHELLVFSSIYNELIRFNKYDGKCCRIELYEGIISNDKEPRQNEIQMVDDEIIIYSPSSCVSNIINMSTMTHRHVNLEVDEEEGIKLIKNISDRGDIHTENRIDTLERFIQSI